MVLTIVGDEPLAIFVSFWESTWEICQFLCDDFHFM